MVEQHGKALVPQIRFSGFTDPWEQRKFADFAVASGIRNRDNLPLRSYSVSNDRGFVPQDEQFENGGTMREADKSAYWIVEPGSFAYNPARINVGSIGYLAANESVIVSSLYEVFQTNGTCDDRFLWHWFKSPLFMKQIEMLQEGGVRLYFFFDKLLQSEIQMPGAEEQRRIGAFFDRLDSLITLHQRKYDKLCVLKKSMLDKMFPKGGSLYPEIRFAGFTDPWEQRKLGQHLKLSRELGHTGVDARKLTVKLWGKGVVEKTDLYGGSAQTQYYIRHAGQFMYGKLDFLHAAFGVVPDKLDCFESTLDSPAFDIEGLDSSFLLNLVTQEDFYLKNGNIANGSRKAKRIHEETFLNMEIRAPELVEQRRIGAFLDRLDSLITLHQRKLELLRNIKKSMLDKMFV